MTRFFVPGRPFRLRVAMEPRRLELDEPFLSRLGCLLLALAHGAGARSGGGLFRAINSPVTESGGGPSPPSTPRVELPDGSGALDLAHGTTTLSFVFDGGSLRIWHCFVSPCAGTAKETHPSVSSHMSAQERTVLVSPLFAG